MPRSDKPTIQITVLDDRRAEECEAGCSIDWSLPESLALARQQARERFGDKLKIDYLNISRTKAKRDMLRWRDEIRDRNLLLPLLLINGQLRIAGPFDIRQLMDAIEFETEIRI